MPTWGMWSITPGRTHLPSASNVSPVLDSEAFAPNTAHHSVFGDQAALQMPVGVTTSPFLSTNFMMISVRPPARPEDGDRCPSNRTDLHRLMVDGVARRRPEARDHNHCHRIDRAGEYNDKQWTQQGLATMSDRARR